MIDINQQPSPQFLQRPAPQALPGEMRFGPGGPVANQAQPPIQSVGKPPPLDVPQIMPQPTPASPTPTPMAGAGPVAPARQRLATALMNKPQSGPMQPAGRPASPVAQMIRQKAPMRPMMAKTNPIFPRGR